MLWTIIPYESIFNHAEAVSPYYDELEIAGEKVVVEHTETNQIRIIRLLSTDPQKYLCPEFQPGAIFRKNVTLS